MLIIAIDLGKFNSVACIYNTQTQKQQFETLATDRGFFETLFKTYNPDLVVVEACGPSGWVSDLCADLNLHFYRTLFLPESLGREMVGIPETSRDDKVRTPRIVA